MFSREFRRQGGAKSKHIFESEGRKTAEDVAGCLPFGVSTGAGVQGNSCYFADVSKIGQDTAGCSAFCPLCCFVFGALLANMASFRVLRAFLGGFVGFVWVCVGLVICVACVAFVRVWS